jgi:hypothetical protein
MRVIGACRIISAFKATKLTIANSVDRVRRAKTVPSDTNVNRIARLFGLFSW